MSLATDNAITATRSKQDNELEHELLEILSRHSIRVPISVVCIAIIIAVFAYGRIHTSFIIIWLFLVFTILLVRWLVLARLPISKRPMQQRLNIAIFLSIVNGLVHSASLTIFLALPHLQQTVLSMFLLGLCTGAMITTAGYLPIYIGYIAPILLTLAVCWSLESDLGWLSHLTGVIFILFGFVLRIAAKDFFHMFKESYLIRRQQRKLNEKLAIALDEAQKSDIAKTRFLASASHDLRQPVHTLNLYMATLSLRSLDENTKTIATHMQTAIKALSTQLDALLDISKLDAGIIKPSYNNVSLNTILDQLYANINVLAQTKKLKLYFDIDDIVTISTDAVLFERIIRNILDNAIKYTQEGSVTLTASVASGRCQLAITDTGCGIRDDQQKQIFEEFFQVHNPQRDRSKGLGLGLSIVKRLCALLEINISLISKIGQGTCVILQFPVTEALPLPVRETPVVSKVLGGLTILILDDETAVAMAMKTLLRSLNSEAIIANNTQQFIEIAKSNKPDLILSDFRLGDGENGINAITKVRKLYPEIPAIIISGDIEPEGLRSAKKINIPCLIKPVDTRLLVDTINQQMSSL